ncbi:trehalose-phosphatase [Thermoplasmatales archaeon AK]|nr:trehalose-phosphatase [Thermoplasmatales archaeon AK]
MRNDLRKAVEGALKSGGMIFLDYDGTLVEIREDPENCYADPDLIRLLARIDEAWELFIVTGRTLEDIDRFLGRQFSVVALHGAIYRPAGGSAFYCNDFPKYRRLSSEIYSQRHRILSEFPGIKIRDKGGSVSFSTWNISEDRKYALKVYLNGISKEYGFELWSGKEIFEMRIPGVNKGTAISRLRSGRPAVIAGDDTTDEESFRCNEDAVTIKVGGGETAARFRVSGVQEMREVLRFITQIRHKGQGASAL